MTDLTTTTVSAEPQVLAPATTTDHALAAAFLQGAAALYRDHVVAGQLALGKLALDTFYNGDFSQFANRGGAQHRALHLLAEEYASGLEQLGLTVEQIRRAIIAARVDAQLPPGLRSQLSASHLFQLYTVASPSDRTRLAQRAVDEHWSVRATVDQVDSYRQQNGQKGRGGRKPLPPAVKVVRAVEKGLAGFTPAVIAELDPTTREKMRLELVRLVGLFG